MPLWQIALSGLIAAWALQALGTYVQMRHYGAVMGDASARWTDGFVGAGNARSRFGAGVIMLVVVGPDQVVRRLMVMRGRSVFARFNPVPDAEGCDLRALRTRTPFTDAMHGKALAIAAGQIEKAAARAGRA